MRLYSMRSRGIDCTVCGEQMGDYVGRAAERQRDAATRVR